MKVKGSPGDIAFDWVNNLFMLGIVVLMLYPFLYVIAVSFSSPQAISSGKVTIYPIGFTTAGYEYILAEPEVYTGYRNTVFYAVSSTILMLIVTSLGAYSLSLKHFVLRKFFTIYLTITMFFSGGMVPTYLLMRNLHILDTVWVMILPGIVSAYNVFIFRTFFQQQPAELRESAFMDGANDLMIWWKIVLPLSKPLFATYGLFQIVGTWNSWFNALIYLKNDNLQPIQMFLRRIVVNADLHSTYSDSASIQMFQMGFMHPMNIQMAAIVVVMVPILCIYPFIQKYFIKGALVGAIKG